MGLSSEMLIKLYYYIHLAYSDSKAKSFQLLQESNPDFSIVSRDRIGKSIAVTPIVGTPIRPYIDKINWPLRLFLVMIHDLTALVTTQTVPGHDFAPTSYIMHPQGSHQ